MIEPDVQEMHTNLDVILLPDPVFGIILIVLFLFFYPYISITDGASALRLLLERQPHSRLSYGGLHMNPIYQNLKTYFGYDSFRPGQEKIITSILSGRDALGIMPTADRCGQIPLLSDSRPHISGPHARRLAAHLADGRSGGGAEAAGDRG